MSGILDTVFIYKPKDAYASGRWLYTDFVVLEGSTAVPDAEVTLQIPPGDLKERTKLISLGILKRNEDNGFYTFTKDHTFSSPSRAANVVGGTRQSGPK